MAVTIVGEFGLSETIGSEVTIDENGVASATVVYDAKREEAVRSALSMESHPDYTWLKRKTIKVTNEEAGISKITATFEGVPPSNTGGTGGGTGTNGGSIVAKYSIKSASNSAPITNHPNFGNWSTPNNSQLLGMKVKEEGEDKGAFIGFNKRDTALRLRFYQVSSFYTPQVSFQETILYERASNVPSGIRADISKVGMIDTPPEAVKSFVNVAEGANWMLTGCDIEEVGFGFRVTKSWLLSPTRLGWNPYIYGNTQNL